VVHRPRPAHRQRLSGTDEHAIEHAAHDEGIVAGGISNELHHANANSCCHAELARLVIRLAAEMVPRPVLVRPIAALACSVAALNNHTPSRTDTELLDSAVIIVGAFEFP